MNLNRFGRIMRARWWALVVVALVSIWIATRLTDFRNEQLPEIEAVASITFLQQLGEVDETGVLTRLENAESLALESNEVQLAERLHPLAPWETSAILRDDRTKQLVFIGRASTEEEAIDLAEALRESFVAQEPFTGVLNIDAQLKSLSGRIVQLRTLIAEATATPPTPDPGEPELMTEAGLLALDAQIRALQAAYTALSVELLKPILPVDPLNPVVRSSGVIEAERASTLEALVALQLQLQEACVGSELAVCQPVVPPEEAADTEFAVDTLSQDLELLFWQIETEQLEAAYRELFLRKVELDTIATINEIEIRESSLIPVNAAANQALALVAGLLVGMMGLLVADRVRKPIWSALEVDSRIALPEIAARGWAVPDGPWYVSTGPGDRKSGIQALRATVEGLNVEGAVTVGIAGIAVHPEDIEEISADLASSVAVSGHRALLIDANLENPSDLVEFPPGATNLSAVLRAVVQDPPTKLAERLLEMFETQHEIIPGFQAMPAGGPSLDAPDLLSRRNFAVLLEVAKSYFDVVIVSGADVASPILQVLSQRLDYLIFLGSAGHTLESAFTAAKREFSDRRAQVAGMAVLTTRPTRLGRVLRRWRSGRPQPSPRTARPSASSQQQTERRVKGEANREAFDEQGDDHRTTVTRNDERERNRR